MTETVSTASTNYAFSSKALIAGGLISIVSLFLPAISILGMSETLFNHSSGKGFAIFFIVVSLISVVVGVVKKRWLHILSLLLGIAILGCAIIFVTSTQEKGANVGIGLWLLLLGGISVFIGSILGMMRK